MSAVPPDVEFLHWLKQECGYHHVRPLPGRRWAAIERKMFTHAIATGRVGDHTSVDDFWCYHTEAAALTALAAWDGTGEPGGWFRHTLSGRRVCEVAGERDQHGREVALGETYVRG